MRLLFLVLCAGCSSGSSASPDLAPVCGYTVSGDVTGAGGCTYEDLCHPTSNDYEAVTVLGANLTSHFYVDGVFTVRSYSAAEMRLIDIRYDVGAKQYAAHKDLADSTASITIDALIAPKSNPCDGVAHGTATATLVEFDGTTAGSGRVTMALRF